MDQEDLEEVQEALEGPIRAPTKRKYNAAISFKRAKGQGRITRIDGLDELMRQYREYLVEQKLLPVGTPRRNWKHTLLSNGHILLRSRHPDWARACELADIVAKYVTMYAA